MDWRTRLKLAEKNERPDMDWHCIGWARATPSLWGRGTGKGNRFCVAEAPPLRVRAVRGKGIILDRDLSFRSLRAGPVIFLTLRLTFKPGSWVEAPITGPEQFLPGEILICDRSLIWEVA